MWRTVLFVACCLALKSFLIGCCLRNKSLVASPGRNQNRMFYTFHINSSENKQQENFSQNLSSKFAPVGKVSVFKWICLIEIHTIHSKLPSFTCFELWNPFDGFRAAGWLMCFRTLTAYSTDFVCHANIFGGIKTINCGEFNVLSVRILGITL